MKNKALFLMMACGVWFFSACMPTEETLPTLVRFPTETVSPAPVVQVDPRNTLPPTFTPTFTATATITHTPAPTQSVVPTISVTPSSTITDTPSPTGTDLPTIAPEERPLLSLALTALAATVLPTDFVVPAYQGINVTLPPTPLPAGIPSPIPAVGSIPTQNTGVIGVPTCSIQPTGGFAGVFSGNPDVAALLGCPTAVQVLQIPAAWQDFQQGMMIWLNGEMLVLYSSTDSYQVFPDTFIAGTDPETSSELPPSGYTAPIRGFLKIWSSNPNVRAGIGWGLNNEQGVTAIVLPFTNGRMVYLPGRGDILVFYGTGAGTWLAFSGQY